MNWGTDTARGQLGLAWHCPLSLPMWAARGQATGDQGFAGKQLRPGTEDLQTGISWEGRVPRITGGSRGVPSVSRVSTLVAPRTTPPETSETPHTDHKAVRDPSTVGKARRKRCTSAELLLGLSECGERTNENKNFPTRE